MHARLDAVDDLTGIAVLTEHRPVAVPSGAVPAAHKGQGGVSPRGAVCAAARKVVHIQRHFLRCGKRCGCQSRKHPDAHHKRQEQGHNAFSSFQNIVLL